MRFLNKLKTGRDPQPKKWKNWLILFSRWLLGSVVGAIIGLALHFLKVIIYPPILGPIIQGQRALFDQLIFSIYYLLFNNYLSSDLRFYLSLIIYATLWGLIGALLLSGKKKQIKIGVVLLVIYLVVGGVYFIFLTISLIG
ncbi:MAG: hypothetical protein QGD88_09435 [Anaerolineae bacterium]|nr:hypothetical protein [Anaerolineae bacterium]MDK1081686.1 hypothetical protein [Anaerolineae bacterium]